MQGIKPTASLADVFDNEIARIVILKPLLIFKWIVHLSKRHRAALEPAVQNFGHATHHRLASWVIWVRTNQIIDCRAMQLLNVNTKIAAKLFETSVNIDTWIIWIVTSPYRYRRTPKSIATNGPVTCILKPLAKTSVLKVIGNPLNLLVQLDHAITNCRDLDKPRTDRFVDQRLASAPTMRISVIVSLMANNDAAFFQHSNNRGVGIKDKLTFEIGNFTGEASA